MDSNNNDTSDLGAAAAENLSDGNNYLSASKYENNSSANNSLIKSFDKMWNHASNTTTLNHFLKDLLLEGKAKNIIKCHKTEEYSAALNKIRAANNIRVRVTKKTNESKITEPKISESRLNEPQLNQSESDQSKPNSSSPSILRRMLTGEYSISEYNSNNNIKTSFDHSNNQTTKSVWELETEKQEKIFNATKQQIQKANNSSLYINRDIYTNSEVVSLKESTSNTLLEDLSKINALTQGEQMWSWNTNSASYNPNKKDEEVDNLQQSWFA